MSKCPNCGATLTCGCQKRKLANGKTGCTKCANGVTTAKEAPKPTPSQSPKPTVNSVKINP